MTGWCCTPRSPPHLYLAQKHGGPLAPKNVAKTAKWAPGSLWAANGGRTSFQSNVVIIAVRQPKGPTDSPHRRFARVEDLQGPFSVLDAALASRRLVGWPPLHRGRHQTWPRFVTLCASVAGELFEAANKVKAWLDACPHARPAFRKMMDVR